MPNILVVLGPTIGALVAGTVILWVSRRTGHRDRLNEQLLEEIQASILRLQERNRQERERAVRAPVKKTTRYVALQPFDETNKEYLRAITQIAAQPEWHWFIWQMEQQATSACKSSGDIEEQRRSIAWIEAFDLIAAKMSEIARKYDEMTNEPENEENDGEISLS